jgi:hypothetical protein
MSLKKALIFIIAFFTFGGYFVINALAIESGLPLGTRMFTVPLRLFICALCAIHFFSLLSKLRLQWTVLIPFALFSIMFIFRIIKSSIEEPELLSRSGFEFVLFFLSFGVIPFVYYNVVPKNRDLIIIENAVVLGSVLLSVIAIVFYRDLLGGDFSRAGGYSSSDDATISPLALSYSAALVLGVALYRIVQLKRKIILNLVILCLGFIPFLLGASRGSVLALLLSLFLVVVANQGLKGFLKTALLLVLLFPIVSYVVEASGSGLIDRMSTIQTQFNPDEVQHSWNRIFIWRTSFEQFLENPISGDFLENRARGHYPHNVVIEALMTTGLIGGIPFIYLLVKGMLKAAQIVRTMPDKGWLSIVFVQVVFMNMFSGGIFSAIWLWSSLGIILAVRLPNKREVVV